MNREISDLKIPAIMLVVHSVSWYTANNQRKMAEEFLGELDVPVSETNIEIIFVVLSSKIHNIRVINISETDILKLEKALFFAVYRNRKSIPDIFYTSTFTYSKESRAAWKYMQSLFKTQEEDERKYSEKEDLYSVQKFLKSVAPGFDITKRIPIAK